MPGHKRPDTIISFYKLPNSSYIKIDSRNKIFEDEVIFTIDKNKLTIRRATIMDVSRRRKLYKHKVSDTYTTTLQYNISIGNYKIDEEESNEDKLVIYLNEQ